MKTKPYIEFFVMANEPTEIFFETALGIPFRVATCETEKEVCLICYLLNEVIKRKVFPGPIATEAERGGHE